MPRQVFDFEPPDRFVAGTVGQPGDRRLPGAQDLVWALLNTKAFQFNH